MLKNAGSNLLETTGNINFTAIPNTFLDTIAPTLNPSELRVMLYIYRHTLGFQKLTDTISYDQFLNGLVTHNNRCLDKGAGVSRNSLVAALASLETRLLIRRQHNGKYGPVTIKLQPAALNDPTETRAIKPSRNTSTVNKETTILSEGITQTESVKANVGELTGHLGVQKLDRLSEMPKQMGDSQVQVLTEIEDFETQKLDLTKETRIQKQKKPIRTANAQIAQANQIIVANVPGISTADADKLVEQAFANGRDQDYISRLVQHVTTNPAIRVPAAVLTTLVRANEDRLAPDPSSLPKAGSKRQFAYGRRAEKGVKPTQGLNGKSPSTRRKIDFNKYTTTSPNLPGELAAAYPEQDSFSSVVVPEKPVQPDYFIDPRLKYSLQEFDSRLAVYVRHLVVEDDLLKIGFFGTKRPQETDLTAWLSSVKVYYPEVSAIRFIEQLI